MCELFELFWKSRTRYLSYYIHKPKTVHTSSSWNIDLDICCTEKRWCNTANSIKNGIKYLCYIYLTTISIEERIKVPEVDAFSNLICYIVTIYVYDPEMRNTYKAMVSFKAMQLTIMCVPIQRCLILTS